MTYVVGFTGTREGMTDVQYETVAGLLTLATEFHHGDCIGADAQAHVAAMQSAPVNCKIVIHPPSDPKLRAFCRDGDSVILRPKTYLERNRDIVDACDLLIVASKENPEDLMKNTGNKVKSAGTLFLTPYKSGTWFTYRYALQTKTNNIVVFPNGDTEVTTYD